MERITVETVRQLAAAVGVRPREERLGDLAQSLAANLNFIERLDSLNLSADEPATTWRLDGGATDGGR